MGSMEWNVFCFACDPFGVCGRVRAATVGLQHGKPHHGVQISTFLMTRLLSLRLFSGLDAKKSCTRLQCVKKLLSAFKLSVYSRKHLLPTLRRTSERISCSNFYQEQSTLDILKLRTTLVISTFFSLSKGSLGINGSVAKTLSTNYIVNKYMTSVANLHCIDCTHWFDPLSLQICG